MDLLATRQKLIASNIANVDTPGYRTRDLNFQSELNAASAPAPVEVENLQMRTDGNNVSIDRETKNLSETSLRFNIATQIMMGEIRATRSAIREGRDS